MNLFDRGKVGFTCSAFDLLHAGHIDMLQQARQVCDYLVVGLQTDPSYDRPSKNKPVQSIIERQIQLKATKLVDEVYVYHTEKDLVDLLNILQFDIRIVGEEYKNKYFTGKNECLSRGIEIWYNERRHSFSSSELRDRIVAASRVDDYNEIHISYSDPYGVDNIQAGGGIDTISFPFMHDTSIDGFNDTVTIGNNDVIGK